MSKDHEDYLNSPNSPTQHPTRHLSFTSQLSSSSSEDTKISSPPGFDHRSSFSPLLLAPPLSPTSNSNNNPNQTSPLLRGSELRSYALADGSAVGKERWSPFSFSLTFSIGLILLVVGLAITMEVLLWLNQQNHGFDNALIRSGNLKGIHFVYTAVVVAMSLPLTAAFGYLDWSIKSVQPYIDLDKGAATANRSVLLNYTADNNFLVLIPALKRRHWLTLLSTVMCIITLTISPLASALFVVSPVNLPVSNHTAQSSTQLGFLDPSTTFSSFASASGFTLAQVLYDAAWPPFVNQDGAISKFVISPGWGKNGSVVTNTFSVNITPNCIPVRATRLPNTVIITTSCITTLSVVDSSSNQFGIHTIDCGNILPELRPVTFISFNADSVNAVVCTPSMEVLNVVASIDLNSGNLVSTSSGPISNSDNPLQNPPLSGGVINGISGSNSTAPDIAGRLEATLSNLATSVAYTPGSLVDAANSVYGVYLNVLALSVYYVPVSTEIPVELHLVQLRLVVSPITAHALAGIFSILAISGTILMFLHRRMRSNIFLPASPGTIASAVSIAGQSELAYLIEARDDEKTCSKLLRRHKFTLDHNGRLVIVQESSPYASKKSKRTSFFEE